VGVDQVVGRPVPAGVPDHRCGDKRHASHGRCV
jgi:hypothetical protein